MKNVKIGQDMDAAAMAAMKPKFEALAASKTDVCFDLSAVEFLDSSGVGGIVFVYKRLRERGLRVALVNVSGQPLRLLRQLRLEFLVQEQSAAA